MAYDSLIQAFLGACSRTPNKTLVHFERQAISYSQLFRYVQQIAGSLNAWGLTRGDRVALYLENSPSFIATYLGVLWLGGVVVPVNTRYRETELRHMLNDSGARLAVTDKAGYANLQGILTECSTVERVLEVGASLERDLDAWCSLEEPKPVEPAGLGPEDLAVIGYTSGTTGRSKGAMLTHGNFCANSTAVTSAWGWTDKDHLLLVLPLFHMHGLGVGLHGTLIRGSTLTLKRKFDAADTLDVLHEGRVSMFFGVPTMYARLLEAARTLNKRPRELRLLVSGSAPLSPQTHAEIEAEFGLRILERYGMTETVMNLGNPLHGERKAGSVGLPFEGVAVRVADLSTDKPLEDGEVDEVQLRGPNITQGYWRDPEASQRAWTSDKWFKTSDLGFRDQDGYVVLTGRAKELIISGGFNVYPREVEEVLAAHPAIAEATVLGLPDADLGKRVVAAVVLRGEADTESIQQFCRDRLASFKKPRDVFYIKSLPRNALGKGQKHVLKEELQRLPGGQTRGGVVANV